VSLRTPEGTTNILQLLGKARLKPSVRATLFRNGMRIFGAPIGVGQGRWPTPAGNFYARDTLTRYRSATYGPIAFAIGARSATRTDWPAGGYIGIRGTDQPSLIPGPVPRLQPVLLDEGPGPR
jgi:hypothetical protein